MSLLTWLCAAWAGGFELAQQSAIAGGTGHAGTARVDAASAWANPAALADDGGGRGMLGLVAAAPTVSVEGDGWGATSASGVATPPHLYGSWSSGRFAAGLAANLAYAGGIAWPEDSAVRFESVSSEPRFLRIAPFVAGDLGPLRVGLGMHVDRGYLHVVRATDHVAEEGLVELALRGGGFGADASLWADAGPVSLGASYKGRSRLSLAGEADFDVPEAFAPRYPDQAITADWRLPDRFSLGASVEAGPIVALLDLGLATWSVNDELVIAMSEDAPDDVVQRNDWRNSLSVRGGVEGVVGRWTARGGGYVDGLTGAPAPPETLSPSSPDCVRVAGTVGGGVAFGLVRLDAFGEALRLLPRESTSPDAPIARYQGHAWIAGLGVTLDERSGRREPPELTAPEALPPEPAPAPQPPADVWK